MNRPSPVLSVEIHMHILDGRHGLCQDMSDFAAMSAAKRSRIPWRLRRFTEAKS